MREVQTVELAEKLGKLRRNELQMTAEQKIQFKEQIRAFKFKIQNLASEILKSFCLDGLRILPGDEAGVNSVIRSVEQIIGEERKKGTFRALGDILLKTADPDAFLEAAYPLRYRVWFEGYGPYWLAQCHYIADRQTYYNPILQMWWHPDEGLWATENGAAWTMAFPPTPELLRRRHQEELAAYEAWEKSRRVQ
jgi:hypothetical protein